MRSLNEALALKDIGEIQKEIAERHEINRKMVGSLFPRILAHEADQLRDRLLELRNPQPRRWAQEYAATFHDNALKYGPIIKPVTSTYGESIVQKSWREMVGKARNQEPMLDPDKEYERARMGSDSRNKTFYLQLYKTNKFNLEEPVTPLSIAIQAKFTDGRLVQFKDNGEGEIVTNPTGQKNVGSIDYDIGEMVLIPSVTDNCTVLEVKFTRADDENILKSIYRCLETLGLEPKDEAGTIRKIDPNSIYVVSVAPDIDIGTIENIRDTLGPLFRRAGGELLLMKGSMSVNGYSLSDIKLIRDKITKLIDAIERKNPTNTSRYDLLSEGPTDE